PTVTGYPCPGQTSALLSERPAPLTVGIFNDLLPMGIVFEGPSPCPDPFRLGAGDWCLQPLLDGGLQEPPLVAEPACGQGLLFDQAQHLRLTEARIRRRFRQGEHLPGGSVASGGHRFGVSDRDRFGLLRSRHGYFLLRGVVAAWREV